MYLGFQTGNILEKFTSSDSLNILYHPQRNLFDQCLFAITKHRYYLWKNNTFNFNSDNVIDLPNSYISLYNYNIAVTSDILGYCANTGKQIALNTVIATHSHRPSRIKKEDVVLMDNSLKNEDKIFFTQKSWESWKFTNNTHVIKYGIPDTLTYDKPYNEREKDILIFGFDNVSVYRNIVEAAKQNNISCDILSSSDISLENLHQHMNKYKICIDLMDHNMINILCGIACGCVGISLLTDSSSDYLSVPGLHLINDLKDLFGLIKNILEKTNNTISQQNSHSIKTEFNFDNFRASILDIYTKNNKEIFIL